MRCDRRGNPDPNGEFDLKDGKIVLRDGTRLHVDIMSFDAAPNTGLFLTDGAAILTDAERVFAISAEGRLAVAKAQALHLRKSAHMADAAPAFTAAMATAALRSAMTGRPAPSNPEPQPARDAVATTRRRWVNERSRLYAADRC